MQGDTITLTDGATGRAVTLPSGRNHSEPASLSGAVRLEGSPSVSVPITATILLKDDGTWHHVNTAYGARPNWYWHFDGVHHERDEYGELVGYTLPDATEAQRRTLARWFFERDARPYGISLGAPVARWAFGGAHPDEIAGRYGYDPVTLA